MSTKLRRMFWWMITLLWAAVIFGFSSLPGSQVPAGNGNVAHFTEYAVLGLLLYAALRIDSSPRKSAILALMIASTYAVTDEIHQSFVPMRVPDLADWLTDSAGAAVGVLVSVVSDAVGAARRRQ